ncbi:sugar kinase [Streptomyces sp. NPDC085481]|uniref:sugar kinase n=1 Tax=Streptomyces sp. NPDC085481 TaxID=3365727 RepID=UPI0037D79398
MTGTPPVDTAVEPLGADVVCLGESMVTFLPARAGRLADVPSFARAIGGAESNVACALAAAGHRTKWVGRVGRDGFGDHLVETIGSYGVDVSAVRRDPDRPTGVYFRTATDRAGDAHEVAYYRAGSAASAMSPETVPCESIAGGRILHLSGITAALSGPCLALMRALTAPWPGRPLVSFDVNFRPGLWRDPVDGGRVLLELARGADLVFVGADEAEEAWGIGEPDGIRAVLPEPEVLVVKRGGDGAVVYERRTSDPAFPWQAGRSGRPASRSGPGPDSAPGPGPGLAPGFAPAPGPAPAPCLAPGPGPDTVTHAPAPRVDVVAPVGAGDAFAAGFLSGTLRGLGAKERMRHGHLMAAAALTVPGDLAFPPARHPTTTPHGAAAGRPSWIAHADRLAALGDEGWGRLQLGPGWTGEDQEGRTS